jgi:hypothetical protein
MTTTSKTNSERGANVARREQRAQVEATLSIGSQI